MTDDREKNILQKEPTAQWHMSHRIAIDARRSQVSHDARARTKRDRVIADGIFCSQNNSTGFHVRECYFTSCQDVLNHSNSNGEKIKLCGHPVSWRQLSC